MNQPEKNISVEQPEGERKRKPGYYWVRFNDGDWVLGLWFFGNYWLLHGSTSNLEDSYFKEINESMACPQEPVSPPSPQSEGKESELRKALEQISKLIINGTDENIPASRLVTKVDLIVTRALSQPPSSIKAEQQDEKDKEQGAYWNKIVSEVAVADICKNTVPGNVEGLNNWKIEVIKRLSEKFIVHQKLNHDSKTT